MLKVMILWIELLLIVWLSYGFISVVVIMKVVSVLFMFRWELLSLLVIVLKNGLNE